MKNNQIDDVVEMKSYLSAFVANSKYSRDLLQIIEGLHRNTSVLLYGEKGCGKEFISKMINEKLENDFYYQICFGYDSEETISVISKKIEEKSKQNYNCTLYLENINLLSKSNQIEILKLIKNENLKVTIISSVCVEENKIVYLEDILDKDLYYRISTIVMNISPLRNRSEDIIPICEFYLKQICLDRKKNIDTFTDLAKKTIIEYFWEENIDELINTIEKGVIFCKNNSLSIDDLKMNNKNSSEVSKDDKTLKTALDDFKRKYVKTILEENGWNQTKTAKILGIQRTYVIKLINELNIRKKDNN